MSEHLTPLDATFLELEEVDDSAHMHIGAIMVFDPTPDGSVPTREQLGAPPGAPARAAAALRPAPLARRTPAGSAGPRGKTIPTST